MQKFCAVFYAAVHHVLRAAHCHAVQFLLRALADAHLRNRVDNDERPLSFEQFFYVVRVCDVSEYEGGLFVGENLFRLFGAARKSDGAAALLEQFMCQNIADVPRTSRNDIR